MTNTGGSPLAGVTRREALKRGAVFGGALLWTTPAIQAIGISRAVAQETSGPCTTYCIKFEFTGADDDLSGEWSALGDGGRGQGNVLVCPMGSVNGLPPVFSDDDDENDFPIVSGDRINGVTIRFPEWCTLVETDESSPDPLDPANVAVKCGQDDKTFDLEVEDGQIFVEGCGGDNAISHIEMLVRCC